jgi:sugar (pentulose or hexulose) kinase
MPHFLGIDIGSSFLKAARIDLDGAGLMQTARVPFPDFLPGLPPAHREADPRAVMNAVESLLREIVRPDCEGVVLCGQMHGFILVDARGEALSNYISWLDQRVTPAEFEEMAALLSEEDRQALGNEFRASIALAQLYWLRRHGRLPAGDATPVSIADYVAGRLCQTPPRMDPTQAAAFGALRIGTLAWHREAIGKLGLDKLRWAEVQPSGTVTGCWQGVPCYTPVGDQQCALAGALLEEGELSINIGTGSQVAMLCREAAPSAYQTRPYFGGAFLRTITHIPAGRALSALIGLLTELAGAAEDGVWERIAAAVAAVPETDVRAAITYFPGPCGSAGFLENLHEGNMTAGHVFRAAFESMARNYAVCAGRLDAERAARGIVFSGGVARQIGLVRELTAAALQLPYRLSPHAEDTLYGLMVLAKTFREARQQAR